MLFFFFIYLISYVKKKTPVKKTYVCCVSILLKRVLVIKDLRWVKEKNTEWTRFKKKNQFSYWYKKVHQSSVCFSFFFVSLSNCCSTKKCCAVSYKQCCRCQIKFSTRRFLKREFWIYLECCPLKKNSPVIVRKFKPKIRNA